MAPACVVNVLLDPSLQHPCVYALTHLTVDNCGDALLMSAGVEVQMRTSLMKSLKMTSLVQSFEVTGTPTFFVYSSQKRRRQARRRRRRRRKAAAAAAAAATPAL